jgi:hypothetical protein
MTINSPSLKGDHPSYQDRFLSNEIVKCNSLLSLYFTISLHQKSVLIRGVVSFEGGEFIVIVFYYFIVSDICPDKRGGEIVICNDNKLSHPQGKPPLLSGHISDTMK